MRKHIFGFLVFVLIVAVFGIAHSYLGIGRIEKAKPPTFETVHLTGSRRTLTYDVKSVMFDLDTGKLISQIHLTWNGGEYPPDTLWISPSISNDQKRSTTAFPSDRINWPFKNGNQVIVTTETPDSNSIAIDGKDNYYALFAFSDDATVIHSSIRELTPRPPVLFVHGESSKIR